MNIINSVFKMKASLGNLVEIKELRNAIYIFNDRKHAGSVLAVMLKDYSGTDSIIFGIPAGGMPVAASMANDLNLELDLLVVSKVTLPWNTEAGYGAVAFDGTIILNNDLISQIGLSNEDTKLGIETAKKKVARRYKKFKGEKEFPDITHKTSIIMDDGIASGYTMLAAINALIKQGSNDIVIAVPTAHQKSIEILTSKVNKIFCANVREGTSFAVASAYKNWMDVDEDDIFKYFTDETP